MLEDEKIDVGDNEEVETEIDLDATAPEQSLDEDIIDVEEISEDSNESNNASEESGEQQNVQADKEELGEYSEGVKKRIAKLTRKMREAERQKEEAIKYAQTVYQQSQTQKNQFENLSGHYTNELEAKVNSGLDAAKLAYRAAVENKDIDAQIAAQQAIAEMTMEDARLKNVKAARTQQVQEKEEQQANFSNQQAANQMPNRQDIYQAAQALDPKAEDWSTKNSWFGTDNAMTYTAFDIHKKLVEEEGFDPQSNDYYVEVDRRIRLEFPHKFAKVEESTTAPVQNVASARRPAANKGRRKTVKLTPSQVAISKRLGVPLEEYAKQLTAKEV
jgi:hypothetical protein|tara:strand:- start:449 stop:1441 length:993 start_codon:yes stop_codon:yes gene_type:complete